VSWRRSSTALLAALGVAVLVLASAGTASALPTVTLKSVFVPVPGYANTGNIFGADAAVQTEYTITGTEYQGTPPPIIGVKLYLPAGTIVRTIGAPTCARTALEQSGPSGCPTGSAAGPAGSADAYVTFGGERVEEQLEASSFFAAAGGLALYFDGHSPLPLELNAGGQYFEPGGASGLELNTELPLVASTPGAPYVSFGSVRETIGWTQAYPGVGIYRVPARCPESGFLSKAEVIFGENGELSRPATVTATYEAPCPTESVEAPVPQTSVPGTGGIVSAPSNKVCLSRRDFPIHVQQIKRLEYRRAEVYVNGRRVAVVKRRRFTATVDLRGLPRGRYTVKIVVTTTSGRTLTGIRAYHTCAPRPLPGGKPRL
jgi:hypothetical protein